MKTVYLTLASLLMAAGCASVRFEDLPDLPQPVEDKALVFFYRDSSFKGGALTYQVHEEERLIGALRSGTFFYHYSEPGQRTYWGQTTIRQSLVLDVAAGETYFIKGDISMGVFAGHPRLTVVEPERAKSSIAKLQYAVPGN